MSRKLHYWPLLTAVVVAGGWALVWLNSAGVFNFAKSYYNVRAASLSAESLASGASVTIGGIRVGEVKSIDPRGDGTVLDLQILKHYGPIPRDSQFAVRTRTIVGENYVALYPGHSKRMLPDNGLLGPGQQQESVDVDQILSVLQGDTRSRAQQLIESLGGALKNRGSALNAFLQGVSGTVQNSAPLTSVLAQDHVQAGELVDQLGQITAAIGTRGDAIRQLATSAKSTFQAIASRNDAVASTLQDLPGALTQVRNTTHILQTITGTAAPVLTDLGAAVNELNPAIHDLAPAATIGTQVVSKLGSVAPSLQTTLTRLRGISTPATQALPGVKSLLCQANPALKYLDPYSKDFGTLLEDMGSALNFYDANGHAARLYATVGADTLQYLSPQAASAMRQLAKLGAIGLHYQLGYSPLPGPNNAGETATSSTATSYENVKSSYPRIKASC